MTPDGRFAPVGGESSLTVDGIALPDSMRIGTIKNPTSRQVFIAPDGSVYGTGSQGIDHEMVAEMLGFISSEDAVAAGLVRARANAGQVTLHFDRDNAQATRHATEFLREHFRTSAFVDLADHDGNLVASSWFNSETDAMRFIRSRGAQGKRYEWDESQHPRVPAGSGDASGEFASSGESASKTPPVLYHGTPGDFDGFRAPEESKGSYWGPGIYLTPSKALASVYGPNIREVKADIRNPFDGDRMISPREARQIVVSVAAGLTEEQQARFWHSWGTRDYPKQASGFFDDLHYATGSKTGAQAVLQRLGYDGVVAKSIPGNDEKEFSDPVWVAFKPEQATLIPAPVERERMRDVIRGKRSAAYEWDESKHPRVPAGSGDASGEWTSGGGQAEGSAVGGATITSRTVTPVPRTQPRSGPSQTSTTPSVPSATTRAMWPLTRDGGTITLGSKDATSGKTILQITDDVEVLKTRAHEAVEPLRRTLAEVATEVRTSTLLGVRAKADTPQGEARLMEKLQRTPRSPATITDYVGGRMSFASDSGDEVVAALERRYPIVADEDFLHDPKYGYRARHVQVMLPNGITAEIQLVPREIAAVQAEAHKAYEQLRSERVSLADIALAQAQSQAIFDAAWKKWTARTGRAHYAPDQPRVPAGSGDPSGEWTSGSGAATQARDAYTGPMPAVDAGDTAWHAWFEREHVWERATRAAVSEGRVTPEEAKARGLSQPGVIDAYTPSYEREGKWVALPQDTDLYHVTTNATGVTRDGLKSRDELGQSRGLGLGGGESDTISFTTDRATAESIFHSVQEARRVAAGGISLKDLVTAAQNGTGADRPWLQRLVNNGSSWLVPNRDWKTGDPLPDDLKAALRGREVKIAGMGTARTDMPQDAEPLGNGWRGGDGQQYFTRWTVPASEDRQREMRFDFYKASAFYREDSGGPMYPVYFLSDEQALARVKPNDIALVTARAKPNTWGYATAGLKEVRTFSGKAVTVTNVQRHTGYYAPDQPRVPAGTSTGGQFAPSGVSAGRESAHAALRMAGWRHGMMEATGTYAHPDHPDETITVHPDGSWYHSGPWRDVSHVEENRPVIARGRAEELVPYLANLKVKAHTVDPDCIWRTINGNPVCITPGHGEHRTDTPSAPARERIDRNLSKFENEAAEIPDHEAGLSLDQDGKTLAWKHGSEHSVNFLVSEVRPGGIVSHNHPGQTSYGYTDGAPSLSEADFSFAINRRLGEMRAITKDFVYSIKPGPKGWPDIPKFWSIVAVEDVAQVHRWEGRIARGEITRGWANSHHNDELWRTVAAHPELRDHLVYTKTPRHA